MTKNSLKIDVFAPVDQHSIALEWDFQATKAQGHPTINFMYVGPNGENSILADMQLKYAESTNQFTQTLFKLFDIEFVANLDVPSLGQKVGVKLTSDVGVSAYRSDVDLNVNWNDAIIETGFMYNVIGAGPQLSAYVRTPYEGYESYSFDLAFGNSNERKTFKAHASWPTDKFGVKLDFGVTSVKNIVIQLQIDLPIPGLKFNTFHLENKVCAFILSYIYIYIHKYTSMVLYK